jgi:hypothetical protein
LGGPRQEATGILKELAQTLASYTAELETNSPEDLRKEVFWGPVLQSQSQVLIDMALRAAALLGTSPKLTPGVS